MKSLPFKPRFGSCLLFTMISIFLLVFACGGDRSSSDDSSSDSGSVVARVVWPDEANQKSQSSARAMNCGVTEVENIVARVFNSASTEVASGDWPCSAGEGTIGKVPPGSGMSLSLEGLDSLGTIKYRGSTSTTFTVSPRETTNVGEIPMVPDDDTLIWDEGNWDEKEWG